MPNIETFSNADFCVEDGEIDTEMFFGDAYRLAACQTVGSGQLLLHFCELGSLRTGDAEFLHPKLQCWTLYSKLRSCSVRACEDPVALLKD
jgi:hypothetical protein